MKIFMWMYSEIQKIEIGSMLQGLADFATAFGVVYLVASHSEMKKQRRQAVKPFVNIQPTNFKVLMEYDFLKTLKFSFSVGDEPPTKQLALYLYNLGTGTARNIKLVWKLNHKAFINAIQAYPPDDNFNYSIQEDHQNIYLKNDSVASSHNKIYWEPSNIAQIGVGQNSPVKINIPYYYFELALIVRNLNSLQGNFEWVNTKRKLLDLNYSISYEDLNGEIYTDDYYLIIEENQFEPQSFRIVISSTAEKNSEVAKKQKALNNNNLTTYASFN